MDPIKKIVELLDDGGGIWSAHRRRDRDVGGDPQHRRL
jgi:hypothetical protein